MAAFSSLLTLLLCVDLLLCVSRVKAQNAGDVRLYGRHGASSGLTAGRLEVYYNGEWGTVCGNGFGATEARTACLSLGFSDYLDYGIVNSIIYGNRFLSASSNTPIWLDDVVCSTFHTRLSQCDHSQIGVHECHHSQDVFVSCLGDGAVTFRTNSGSLSSIAGRLEIYWNGTWGTVCGNSTRLADVVCHQLGYDTDGFAASAISSGNVLTLGYTPGTGTIWLGNVICGTNDFMLTACTHNGFGAADCTHSEDIAVICGSSDITSSPSSTDLYSSPSSPILSTHTSVVISGGGTSTVITVGGIVAIVIVVVVLIICMIVCVIVIGIAILFCAVGASNRNKNRHENIAATAATYRQPAPGIAMVTTTETAQPQAPPPSYSDVEKAPYPSHPPQGQTCPQPQYPLQQSTAQNPADSSGISDTPLQTLPPQATSLQTAPSQAVSPQPYPDEKQELEMQQYPGGSDPA